MTEVVEMSSNLSSNFLQFNFGMENGFKHSIYGFDKFRLDCSKLMLYREGESVTLPPKVIKTLAVLVENRGSILSKDELMESVWEDSIVEEANLSQNLYLLRKTLGMRPDGSPYIETLRRRGYRFNGDVERVTEDQPEAPAAARPLSQPQPEPVSVFSGVEREGNVLRVVEWPSSDVTAQRTEPAANVPRKLVAPPLVQESRSTLLRRLALAGLGLLVLVAGAAFLWPRFMPAATTAESQGEVSVTRLTNGFFPYGATISLDGNFFVYHEVDGEMSRIFVQQTGQSSRVEIASSLTHVYGSKTFSADGQSIFYLAADKKSRVSSLYRIPTMGGSPVKIIDEVHGPVSISPDGKEMAFCRRSQNGDTALVIAGTDGRAERVVAQRSNPKVLLSAVAWSPDGKVIMFGDRDHYDGRATPTHRLNVLNIATGRTTLLSNENWDNFLRIVWAQDGSGIIAVGTRDGDGYSTRRDQIYFISYPDGVSRRLTSDGNRHEPDSLGVTRKGGVFSVTANRSAQLWVMASDGNTNSAVQLTRGTADGRSGIGPLPDGRFAYLARNAEEISIMVSDAEGTSTKQLATGFQFIEELRADPLGRFLVFSAAKDGKNQIYRIDLDGGNLKQLTPNAGSSIDSSISPDGKHIVFDSVIDGNDQQNFTLMRTGIDGGQPITLTKGCFLPTYSPDGSLISCVSSVRAEIVIVSAADGAEVERHSLPVFATWNFGIGWTADGSGLVYIGNEKGTSNLWVQPRDGAKARPLTNFTSGIIYRYAFTPDGSKIYIARGYPTQDAILIKNFR
jgi:Tol biopolymer transport system component/DNA-binding winged helix-turn-helix (wHTH) protein